MLRRAAPTAGLDILVFAVIGGITAVVVMPALQFLLVIIVVAFLVTGQYRAGARRQWGEGMA
ncbi:hypothetical protein [Rhizobium anhuiense]|uniref:hypothetical protein n=1 Tax=Rhizobium anhuiense TaxID=1184720 RepID=UPI0015CF5DEE|nr:hypothetical protein [Rhizobium anhuiense]